MTTISFPLFHIRFFNLSHCRLIAYWIGRSPSTYYHYWTIKCCVLFPLRWWEYRAKGWHYLMLGKGCIQIFRCYAHFSHRKGLHSWVHKGMRHK